MLLLPPAFRFSVLTCLIVLGVSCGQPAVPYDSDIYTPPRDLAIDPDLKPLLESYLADSAAAGVPVPEAKIQEFQGLMWTDHVDTTAAKDATILGICHRKKGLRYVEILKPDGEGKVGQTVFDDITLKVMVYHELGHCLHDFSGHTRSEGATIMNAHLQPARYFDPEGLFQDHFHMLKAMQDDPSFRP